MIQIMGSSHTSGGDPKKGGDIHRYYRSTKKSDSKVARKSDKSLQLSATL